MQSLSQGVSRITNGDLDHLVQQKGLVYAEFMGLSDSFNTMTAKLKDSYQQLDEYSKSLEQKVMERTRALKNAQANLLQQAHEVGMAEMAVGILHNIGNAITPAKVGTATLVKRLTLSPMRNNLNVAMDQIYTAMEKPPFIQDEEKDRLLSVIKLLPESIKEEYDTIIDEIQQIRNKHEHIEEVISLQMRYARFSTDFEDVDINRLTEDALKIIDESIRKRSVQIIRDFSDIPVVRIEQSKFIQIIVNLIKNAYEAMETMESDDRQIIVTTFFEKGPPDHVVLSIKDKGIGFSPQDKEKLFKFGYTTKDKGTGFGLHSCANYLIAHKGSIEAMSRGRGLGAEFIVRLALVHS
ncbi:MAG: GHKL domain-containing protein [Desulfobacterales bacterium]|nr:GHKL domain-containing protein [Desulfobacterales bacterium]